VTGVWFTKLFVHPVSPGSPGEFYDRLAVGDLIPSGVVAVTAAVFVGAATVLAMSCPSQERLEAFADVLAPEPSAPAPAVASEPGT
jgi:hypothetical protein